MYVYANVFLNFQKISREFRDNVDVLFSSKPAPNLFARIFTQPANVKPLKGV